MEDHRFDLITRTLTQAGARRWVLRLLVALPFGGVASLLAEEADARRNRHTLRHRRGDRRARVHDEKHKKRKKKKKLSPSPPALPPSLPPPPSSPPPPVPPPPPTCTQTCAGCCNGETCESGTTTAACGAGGAPCAVCSGVQAICLDGACRCDVCASGCPYPSVQAAIADPAGPTTIRICAGTYHEDVTIDRNVTLIGAGDGDGAADTILEGTGISSVIAINPALADVGPTVAVQGLRITGGDVSDFGGGGVFNWHSTVTMADCTITGNHADTGYGGGGISSFFSTVTLANCTVSDNSGGPNGGGIRHAGGTLTLDASHVSHNNASIGGGIYIHLTAVKGIVTLQNGSTVTLNEAAADGGIANAGTLNVLSGSSVSRNTSTLDGGGVGNNGTLTLDSGDISYNTTTNKGGGVNNVVGGLLTLLNGSTIVGNRVTAATGTGGGVYNKGTVDPTGGSITSNIPDQCVDDGGTGCPP